MKYQLINQEQVANLKDRDDALLNDGLTIAIAEGETDNGVKFVAQLRAVGEIRAFYKSPKHEDDIELRNGDIEDIFETNQELNEAQENSTLIIDNNNWYDIEFIVNGDYLEPGDQDIAYTISEGVDTIKEMLADKNFIKYMEDQANV